MSRSNGSPSSMTSQRSAWSIVLAVALAGLIATFVACKGKESTAESEEPPRQETQLEDVKEEMREAAATVEAYTFEQREEFEQWGRDRLAELDAQIDELRANAEQMGQEARGEWEEMVSEIESEREVLDAKLDAALESAAEAWLELQAGFVDAQEELAASIDRAADKLSTEEVSEQEQ